MSKQTAVEHLEGIIHAMIGNGADFGEDFPALMIHIENTKEMEKEQILDAWEDGHDSFSTRSEEQYYNETFNK